MNRYRITLIDTANGEIFTEYMEQFGWPAIVEPYCGTSGRCGMILKIEKSMTPAQGNRYP